MKSKSTAALWALFLGGIGAHKFYLGQTGQGLLYLLFCWTGIPMLVSLYEAVKYHYMNVDKFNAAYNADVAIDGHNLTKLEKLHDLKAKGVITEDEFNNQKKKMIA